MASRQAEAVQRTHSSNVTTSTTTNSTTLQKQAEHRTRILDEYFESTKLLQVIQDFISDLAGRFKTQFRLSANPYPDLLKAIRMHELRQADVLLSNGSSSSSLELTVLGGQASIPAQFQVCGVEHDHFAMPIWGLKSTLEKLTGANLYGLLELVSTAFQGLVTYKEFTDDECQATAYGVLVGNGIFGARLQDLQPCFLELETHVFVSGVLLEKTMAVFARFLLKQLHEASNAAATFASLSSEEAMAYHGCVVCDGISILPPASPSIESSAQDAASVVWTIERVLESRVAFINAVKTALVSNSLITLNRYDSAKLSNSEGSYLCQVEKAFFFHFALADGCKSVDSTARRSFFVGSRALTSGIFFDSKGALDVTAKFRAAQEEEERKKQSHNKRQVKFPIIESAVSLPGARPRSGFIGVLQNVMDSLRQVGLGIDAFRQQTNRLVGCFAYSLGYLVAAHQVLESLVCHQSGSAALMVVIHASFIGLEIRMKKCMEEANTSPQTSMLHPISSHLRFLYGQAQAASVMDREQHVDEFVELLRCVDELLLLVVRVTFSDFLRLVKTTTAVPAASTTLNTPVKTQLGIDSTILEEIDVLRALEMAVEERKYPAAIVSEAVFAQVVVDSCLDVALESAVMNTVAIHLPPNPFIDMSGNLQVFALRQLVWNQDLQPTPSNKITKIPAAGLLKLFLLEGTNLCAVNPRLLQLISGDKIIQSHQWLTDHHILHEGTFKPFKSSYSAAIFPMMLAWHPLVFFSQARRSEASCFLKDLDVVEHYVLEGKELSQARSFFVEAVCRDLRRISAANSSSKNPNGGNCWKLLVEAQVIDSHGQIVTALDLSPLTPDDLLVAILEEATQKRLVMQVIIQIAEVLNQGDTSLLTLHKVTKMYMFHHRCTDDADVAGSPTLMPPLLSFRVSKYGVFFSKENALFCLQNMESNVHHRGAKIHVPRDEWTPYASQAFQFDDSLLVYELDIVHESSSRSSPQLHRDNELVTRLVAHSHICQLYLLERAVRWLLNAMKSKLQQLTKLKSRKEEISTGLPPATVFSIHCRLALQIIAQMEMLVVPLNHQLQFVHQLSDCLTTLRKCIAGWEITQPPTEEQLELHRTQQEKAPEMIPPTPREDPVSITSELVESLRATSILLLFFRFSYQRAFFANADCKREPSGGSGSCYNSSKYPQK